MKKKNTKKSIISLLKIFFGTLFFKSGFGSMFLLWYSLIIFLSGFLSFFFFLPFLLSCGDGSFIPFCLPNGWLLGIMASYPGYYFYGFLKNFIGFSDSILGDFFPHFFQFFISAAIYFTVGMIIDGFVKKPKKEILENKKKVSFKKRIFIYVFYFLPIILYVLTPLMKFNSWSCSKCFIILISTSFCLMTLISLIGSYFLYYEENKEEDFIMKYLLPLFAWHSVMIFVLSFKIIFV